MSLLVPPTGAAVATPLRAPDTARSAAHGRPVLEVGHGLKDWIRLSRQSEDLSGTQGQLLRVTTHELAKHCTEEDAWTAINGEQGRLGHRPLGHCGPWGKGRGLKCVFSLQVACTT